jgi:pullulanase
MKKLITISMTALVLSCSPDQEAFHFDEMTYSPSETVFRLFAPADADCFVRLGDDSLRMQLDKDSIWMATVKGDHKGKTYEFVVNGQASPGVFAKALTVNGQKAVVVDMCDSNPEGWESDVPVRRPAQDIVVYEMHHRDFSIARPDAKYPGKYLALTEPWAIDHLQQLGINAVHILPSYDYGSVDETRLDEPQYNWGYDPVNYNVPEGSYSTDPTDPLCRIREFKQMVQALHKAGIAVILDVVYNHTFDIDHSNFQRTYPDYYYRKIRNEKSEVGNGNGETGNGVPAEFSYSNGSGCGNETASEQPMMRRFMVESVKYWVNEYHVDGFRFDLMGCHDIETMNIIRQELDAIDSTLFIYGEGWSAGACALPNEQLGMKANIAQMPRIAAFSDEMRDALRGPFSDDTKMGWLGLSSAVGCDADLGALKESLKFGIVGCIEHPQVDQSLVNYAKQPWAAEPIQMMSYVSCHDDMCLVDRLKASIPNISENKLISLDLLAQTAVFTSQGVPFMLSGEELLRTKLGVHNSYNSPDSINHLEWANKERYSQLFDYYCRLIELRKNHPAFRLGSADLVRQHLEFLETPDNVLAFCLKDNAGGDTWKNIVVILNSSAVMQRVTMPGARYMIVCQDGRINEQGLGTIDGETATVAPFSALILHD